MAARIGLGLLIVDGKAQRLGQHETHGKGRQ
jgi:hypothetical protein